MAKDTLYRNTGSPVPPFEFDAQVVQVFDDMIHRSIPFYAEIIGRQAQLIEHHYQPGTAIYDLGCSNGNLGIRICQHMAAKPWTMIAVDNSNPMLEAYQIRLDDHPLGDRVELRCQDVCDAVIQKASVVVLNFTLQFIPPGARDALISRIYSGLTPGGILLFSEKIIHRNDALTRLQQDFYHRFKRENGYSDLEISRKREALEKVLIPETLEQHVRRLQSAGFGAIDVWQKWFNFAALIAIK